jgi:Holliday junction resolvasome RuvABC DNA-binding subunit
VLGLIALGFKQSEAQKAVTELVKSKGSDPALTADRLIRESLRALNF